MTKIRTPLLRRIKNTRTGLYYHAGSYGGHFGKTGLTLA